MSNKMKSNRAAMKRFKKTGTGKLKFNHVNRRHILTKKSAKRMRRARVPGILTSGDMKIVKKLILGI